MLHWSWVEMCHARRIARHILRPPTAYIAREDAHHTGSGAAYQVKGERLLAFADETAKNTSRALRDLGLYYEFTRQIPDFAVPFLRDVNGQLILDPNTNMPQYECARAAADKMPDPLDESRNVDILPLEHRRTLANAIPLKEMEDTKANELLRDPLTERQVTMDFQN